MNPETTERIKRFMRDESANKAVYGQIQKSFLKTKQGDDIHMKAARFVALELLDEAWKDLSYIKNVDSAPTETANIGL